VELGPVTHRRGLERVGEELARRVRLSTLNLHQAQDQAWLEVELADSGTRWVKRARRNVGCDYNNVHLVQPGT
jgi:hypothetical protein